jgi:RNA polymerase sigma factor (sigma-70 family)
MTRGAFGNILHQFRKLIAKDRAAEQSDGRLLERFVNLHDEAAFGELVGRHGPMVVNVCQRVLQDRHASEDAFQATFLVLVRRAGSLDGRSSVASWLYTVAFHIALRARAALARRRIHERQVPEMPQPESTPESDWEELRPLLDEELSQLPEKYRAPLVLCYLEGMTNEQAARELGWPMGSMAKRLARGREMLRARLTRRQVALSAGVLGTALADNALAEGLPAALTTATVRAALLFAAGEAAAAGISAPAVNLAHGALKALALARLKLLAIALLLAVGAVGTGAALFMHAVAAPPQVVAHYQPAPAAAPKPADARKENPASAPTEVVKTKQVVTAKQRTILPEDALEVHALTFAADGKTLVSAHGEKRPLLVLWDTETEQVGHRYPVHAAEIRAVVFSAKGDRLATASRDKTAKVLDSGTGAVLTTLQGHGGSVHAVAYSGDGQTLATGSSDKTVRLWDAATGRYQATLSGHGEAVLAIAFVPQSKLLISGGRDRTIKLWDWAERTEPATLRGHTDWVNALACSPDGKLLASASKDKTVKLWDLTAEAPEPTGLEGHQAPVLAVAFSADGQTLATGSEDGTVILWDVAERKQWTTLAAHTAAVNAVAFSPDGKTLATASKDKTVKLWDVQGK